MPQPEQGRERKTLELKGSGGVLTLATGQLMVLFTKRREIQGQGCFVGRWGTEIRSKHIEWADLLLSSA